MRPRVVRVVVARSMLELGQSEVPALLIKATLVEARLVLGKSARLVVVVQGLSVQRQSPLSVVRVALASVPISTVRQPHAVAVAAVQRIVAPTPLR